MPTIPFQAATWQKRSDIPNPTLFGALSGAVQSVAGASLHPASKVVQTFGVPARSNEHYFGAAQASSDEGKTWFDTYRGDQFADQAAAEYVFQTWSLDTPSGTYHYQARARVGHAFLLADGTLRSGGIRIYASDGSSNSFSLIQELYAWPHVIADPPSTGGNNVLSAAPALSAPIMLAGSGPHGEDAFWMAVSFQIDCGGTNNRQTFRAADLWRSIDGFEWVKVRDLSVVSPFSDVSPVVQFGPLFRSATGRLFLGTYYTNTHNADLLTTGWTLIGGLVPFMGNIVPMYGGTLSSYRNGSLISTGFALVSCDDGGNMVSVGAPTIPIGAVALNLKLGPSEVILVSPGFSNPTTETVCYYSADGGETWQGGEVWLASGVGERPVGMFLKSDSRPLVITTQRAFVSTDLPRGVFSTRTVCPLANAGLFPARPLNLCGHSITVNPCN